MLFPNRKLKNQLYTQSMLSDIFILFSVDKFSILLEKIKTTKKNTAIIESSKENALYLEWILNEHGIKTDKNGVVSVYYINYPSPELALVAERVIFFSLPMSPDEVKYIRGRFVENNISEWLLLAERIDLEILFRKWQRRYPIWYKLKNWLRNGPRYRFEKIGLESVIEEMGIEKKTPINLNKMLKTEYDKKRRSRYDEACIIEKWASSAFSEKQRIKRFTQEEKTLVSALFRKHAKPKTEDLFRVLIGYSMVDFMTPGFARLRGMDRRSFEEILISLKNRGVIYFCDKGTRICLADDFSAWVRGRNEEFDTL